MSKEGVILDKLMEISERLAIVETKVDRVSSDMVEVKAQDEIQNRLLAEHIAGVESARELIAIEKQSRIDALSEKDTKIKDLDVRLQVVETPSKVISHAKTALIWIGGIAGAVVSIAKFIGLF